MKWCREQIHKTQIDLILEIIAEGNKFRQAKVQLASHSFPGKQRKGIQVAAEICLASKSPVAGSTEENAGAVLGRIVRGCGMVRWGRLAGKSALVNQWRRGWDLNPRYPLRYVRFRGGSFQPLTHLSTCKKLLAVVSSQPKPRFLAALGMTDSPRLSQSLPVSI